MPLNKEEGKVAFREGMRLDFINEGQMEKSRQYNFALLLQEMYLWAQ